MKFLPVLFVLLAGCSTSSISGKPVPDITFQHIQPLQLPVSDVVIDNKGGADYAQAPNFSIAFEEVVQNYVRRKLHPAGGTPVLNVVIDEMSVKEGYEKSQNSVGDFLGVAGAEVYDVRLAMNIAAHQPNGAEKGMRISAARKIKVSEHASIAERERKQLEGLETMFRELDASVTRIVTQDLNLPAVSTGSLAPIRAQPDEPGQWNSYQPPVPLYQPEEAPDVPQEAPSDAKNGVIERQEL